MAVMITLVMTIMPPASLAALTDTFMVAVAPPASLEPELGESEMEPGAPLLTVAVQSSCPPPILVMLTS